MKAFTTFCICFLLLLIVGMLAVPAVAQTKVSDVPQCNQLVILDNATATTKIVTAPTATTTSVYVNGTATTRSTAKKVHVCAVTYRVKQDVAAADFGLVTGTGSNCATGKANFTPQWIGTGSVVDSLSIRYGSDGALIVPGGKDLCLSLSATPTKAQVEVSYAVY